MLFGDIAGSRRAASAASAWLTQLRERLDEHYGSDRLAPFEFTQGDEIQGLLRPTADPFAGVLLANLEATAPRTRWAVVAGAVDPGGGPATHRTGPAFLTARATSELARQGRDALLVVTGDPRSDRLLSDMAPVLGELLWGLTARQREIARLALLEGRRQTDIATELGVSRATISVTFARARLRSLARLLDAIRLSFREGLDAALPVTPDEVQQT